MERKDRPFGLLSSGLDLHPVIERMRLEGPQPDDSPRLIDIVKDAMEADTKYYSTQVSAENEYLLEDLGQLARALWTMANELAHVLYLTDSVRPLLYSSATQLLEAFDEGRLWAKGMTSGPARCLVLMADKIELPYRVGLMNLLRELVKERLGRHASITTYNDHPDTTWPDVQHLLEEAIERTAPGGQDV